MSLESQLGRAQENTGRLSPLEDLHIDDTTSKNTRLLSQELTPGDKQGSEISAATNNAKGSDGGGKEGSNTSIRVHRRAPLYERVGLWLLALSVLSAILLIAALGFLSWVWWGTRSASRWRRLMIQGWSKQAVTISAIIIRLAISSLATTSISMIAAVALETRGVLLDRFAHVSIARFSNNGPETFWIPAFFDKAFLEPRPRILLVLLLCTTIASQFSSTLLLSDFGQGPVLGFATTVAVNFATFPSIISETLKEDDSSNFTTTDNYWGHYPKQFAAFAEYSEPGNSSDGVDDTGITLRSFLPFSNQTDRESLLEFHGIAPVFDTRSVCVRPTFTGLGFNVSGNGDSGTMVGQVSYTTSIPGRPKACVFNLENDSDKCDPKVADQILPTTFSCEMSSWTPGERTICILKDAAYSTPGVTPMDWYLRWTPIFDRRYNDSSFWVGTPNTGNMYLIVEPLRRPGSFWKTDKAPGPWSVITLRNVTKKFDCTSCWDNLAEPNCTNCREIPFRASLCFDAFPSSITYIILFYRMSMYPCQALRNEWNQVCLYDKILDSFQTDNITKQLGISKDVLDYEDRGILQLDGASLMQRLARQRSEWWSSNSTESSTDTLWRILIETCTYWTPIVAFSSARSYTVTNSNKIIFDIFNNTIESTDSPAKALQAILTVLLGSAYYDPLPFTNYESQASTTSMQFAFVPLHSRGLWGVIAIVCAHVLLVVLVAIDFAARTKKSLLNNVWQAVAQIADNENAADVLQNADMITDKKVSKELKAVDKISGQSPKFIKLE